MPLNEFKFDSIRGNSNIHYDIYRIFNAFPLYLTSIQKSPQNPHRPIWMLHSPHIHPIPIHMGIPMGIPIPTAALVVLSSADVCLWLTDPYLSVNTITPESLDISSRNFQGIILWSKGRPSSKMATWAGVVHGGEKTPLMF